MRIDSIRLNTLKVPFYYTPFIMNQDNEVKLGCVLCIPTDHLTNHLNPLLVTISLPYGDGNTKGYRNFSTVKSPISKFRFSAFEVKLPLDSEFIG
jgi:hypothetical protein